MSGPRPTELNLDTWTDEQLLTRIGLFEAELAGLKDAQAGLHDGAIAMRSEIEPRLDRLRREIERRRQCVVEGPRICRT